MEAPRAAHEERWDAMKEHIRSGHNVNGQYLGGTVLQHAVLSRNVDAAQFLLDNGATVNEKTDVLEFPILLALKKGDYDMIKLLLERGAKTTGFQEHHFDNVLQFVYQLSTKSNITERIIDLLRQYVQQESAVNRTL
jgi:ankyrin repeat protein